MNILQLQHISIRFGGLMAIHDLSLEVAKGELRCIIGPNGAGKSTLFNLICGVFEPGDGKIIFNGQPLNGMSIAQRARIGIGRKFQAPTIFDNLSVLENLQVAAEGSSTLWGLIRANGSQIAQAVRRVDEVLEQIELKNKRNVEAYKLSHGEKQWLEIGLVLTSRPALLLLDEPTAGMTPAETHRTSQLIKGIAQETTTIVIEHDLKFIREIANIVTVLHRGSVLAEGPIDEIASNAAVREAYLGSKVL